MSKINPDHTLHIQRCCVRGVFVKCTELQRTFYKTPLTQHRWMWRMWSGLILLMGAPTLLAHKIRSLNRTQQLLLYSWNWIADHLLLGWDWFCRDGLASDVAPGGWDPVAYHTRILVCAT
jgi:hypothetical protein